MLTEREVLDKLASYKDAIIKLKTERDSYRTASEEMEAKYNKEKETSLKLERDILDLEDKLDQKVSEIETLKTENSEIKTQKEQRDSEFNIIYGKNQVASKDLYEKELELAELRNKVGELEKANSQTKYSEDSHIEFINEIEKLINEADEVLRN